MSDKPDIRTDVMTDEQYQHNCFHGLEGCALYMPPDKFAFHHYDESPDNVLIAERPMVGMEVYVVHGMNGGFYGRYQTSSVAKYIKTKTWIMIDKTEHFLRVEIQQLERQLEAKKSELAAVRCKKEVPL